jgi:hypothetical protein
MNDGFVFLTALTTHMILRDAPIWPNGKVSDGSQPPMALDLSASETAGSRSLQRLVRIFDV